MKKTIKFRNIFLLLVSSFLMLTSLTAQKGSYDGCLVDMPPYAPEPVNDNLWCIPQSYYYQIRIAFHIVRKSDGTGGTTQDQLDAAIKILKQDFSPTITFDIVKIDDVLSTSTKNYFIGNAYQLSNTGGSTPSLFFDLVAENVVPKALNVYLGPSSNSTDGGIASPSRLACTIGGSRVDADGTRPNYLVTSHAISHEVGHLLGLLHTFQRQTSENAAIPPLVNGQDCGTTGDLVCDTPVDPTQPRVDLSSYFDFRPSLSNCVWNNTTKKDRNGVLYQPSTTNIMAYTHLSCMEAFTQGQFRKMHNTCLSSAALIPAVTYYEVNWIRCPGAGYVTALKTLFKTVALEFKVFPNPATEFLAVQFLSDSHETTVQIMDITGKSLYKKSLGKTVKNEVHDIDFNTLPKGIHILTVSNELDKKNTKIVIQ